MFDLDASLESQLLAGTTLKPTVVFPEPDDPRVLNAASRLLQFANVILVGKPAEVVGLLDHGAATLACGRDRFFSRVRVVDPAAEEELGRELAGRLAGLSQGKKWQLDPAAAAKLVKDPVHFAVMLVREGYADAVLGGVTHATRDFLMPCLRLLPSEGTAFEMGLFALPDEEEGPLFRRNLVMFADVALNVEPTPAQLADIAVGACRTMRDLIPVEALPEIVGALVSYSTKGSGSGPSVERIRAAEPLIAERLARLREENPLYGSIAILAELQVSVAVNPGAAKTKLKEQFAALKGAGRANVLIVPALDVGNLLYHLYSTRYPAAQSTLIMGGLRHQALDYSRGSTPEQIARGAKALLLGRLRSPHYRPTPKDRFFPRHRVLALNPGSTSTKAALFLGEQTLFSAAVEHGFAELAAFPRVADQFAFRLKAVEALLAPHAEELAGLEAVVSRAGLLAGAEAGAYVVDPALVEELGARATGEHAANLGAALAQEVAARWGVPAYVVDAPTVDEREELAKVTGLRKVAGRVVWHALSQKSAARRHAEERNRDYAELNLIVAHLGGGISIGAHRRGRCVQVNHALFEGPLAPSRAGSLPGDQLIALCYSGVPRPELERRLTSQGGLVSHFGTNDLRKVEDLAARGEREAALVVAAMARQIACQVAALIPHFQGEPVDRVILTGGLCHSGALVAAIRQGLAALGVGITVYPGGLELEALRDAGLRILKGGESARRYQPGD